MKTQQEILKRVKSITENNYNDIFGCWFGDLAVYLNKDDIKQFCKDGADLSRFPEPLSDDIIKKEIENYLEFAYEKADDQRGISSERSIIHFTNWLWLLDDFELLSFAQDESNYPYYGLPILDKIAQKYNIELYKGRKK